MRAGRIAAVNWRQIASARDAAHRPREPCRLRAQELFSALFGRAADGEDAAPFAFTMFIVLCLVTLFPQLALWQVYLK